MSNIRIVIFNAIYFTMTFDFLTISTFLHKCSIFSLLHELLNSGIGRLTECQTNLLIVLIENGVIVLHETEAKDVVFEHIVCLEINHAQIRFFQFATALDIVLSHHIAFLASHREN